MITPAFSTLACPDWTLDRVAAFGSEAGFESVELRTFGPTSNQMACDPFLTDDAKVRRLFAGRGIEISSIASSCRFDEAVLPPVIGHVIRDTERSIREAKRVIDLSVALECPFVRVFGFEFPGRERRSSALARIAGRLKLVIDHAHRTGVRVVVENGGSFATADQLVELIELVGSPLLGGCYSIAVGRQAGDEPRRAIATLADRLWVARVKDLKDGRPCPLGEGDVGAQAFVEGLASAGFAGPLVFEWDRLWMPELDDATTVLPSAAKTLYNWLSRRSDDGAARATTAARV